MYIESHDEDVIIGADGAKAALLDMLFFQNSNKVEMASLGVPIERGVLLYGIPGTGKSKLARVVSGKYASNIGHNVEIYPIKGKHYMRGRVGGSSVALDELFSDFHKRIKDNPMLEIIVIFDEIEILVPKRGGRKSLEMERTNAFINEFDDIRSSIFVIGTTNFPMLIDSAVLRPGRMAPIFVPIPTREERILIFQKYVWNIGVLDLISAEDLADNSVDFTGADIAMSKNKFYTFMKKKQDKKEDITRDDLLTLLKERPGSLNAQMEIAKFQAKYMRDTGQSKSNAEGHITDM